MRQMVRLERFLACRRRVRSPDQLVAQYERRFRRLNKEFDVTAFLSDVDRYVFPYLEPYCAYLATGPVRRKDLDVNVIANGQTFAGPSP